MGTLLHAKRAAIDASFDAINLHNLPLAAEIHRDYIEAGADIVETNSFCTGHLFGASLWPI